MTRLTRRISGERMERQRRASKAAISGITVPTKKQIEAWQRVFSEDQQHNKSTTESSDSECAEDNRQYLKGRSRTTDRTKKIKLPIMA